MKTKQFILTKVAFAALALMAFTFTSCEKDDEFIGDETVTAPLSEIEELEIFEISLTDTGGHHVRVRYTIEPF